MKPESATAAERHVEGHRLLVGPWCGEEECPSRGLGLAASVQHLRSNVSVAREDIFAQMCAVQSVVSPPSGPSPCDTAEDSSGVLLNVGCGVHRTHLGKDPMGPALHFPPGNSNSSGMSNHGSSDSTAPSGDLRATEKALDKPLADSVTDQVGMATSSPPPTTGAASLVHPIPRFAELLERQAELMQQWEDEQRRTGEVPAAVRRCRQNITLGTPDSCESESGADNEGPPRGNRTARPLYHSSSSHDYSSSSEDEAEEEEESVGASCL